MAFDKGQIRIDEIPAFKAWLDANAVGWNPGLGLWEVIRVNYGTRVQVVTRNKQDHLSSPEELRPLLQQFRVFLNPPQTPEVKDEITDTERLDFMLSKGRQVVVEIEGWGSEGRHFAVYVTQGVMSDREYPAVKFTCEDFKGGSDEGRKIKREAIDLAINEVRSESSD